LTNGGKEDILWSSKYFKKIKSEKQIHKMDLNKMYFKGE